MVASRSQPDFRRVSAGLMLAALVACGDDPAAPVLPPVMGEITVDASAAYAYVGITGDSLKAVAVADPAASTAWDLGFFSTTVTTNGGAAGPGGVDVFCVCNNAAATAPEIQAMTAASELADFEAVTASDIAAATFASDQLAPAINGWYMGAGAAATVAPGRAWIVREGTTSVVLGKFRVTAIQNPTAGAMGTVTFEFAVQPAAGQPFGAVQSATVTVGASPVYVDLTTGAVTDAADWDLRFDGWTIRMNSGVSGSGSFRAVLDTSTPFATIDAAYAATAPLQAYSADAFSGAFSQNRWYRYNITGTDNQIWPVFNVYLVRRGTTVFKVQLTGYYGPAGEPRRITVRYQKLAD